MLWLGAITLDCADPVRLADCWAAALGYEIEDASSDPSVALVHSEQTRPRLSLQRVPEPKVVKNRMHICLGTDARAAAAARLSGLGARKRLGWPEQVPEWTVLADPEGNEFRVVG